MAADFTAMALPQKPIDLTGRTILQVIPELDIVLEVEDNTLTIFNGQDILHGVSTIEYEN